MVALEVTDNEESHKCANTIFVHLAAALAAHGRFLAEQEWFNCVPIDTGEVRR